MAGAELRRLVPELISFFQRKVLDLRFWLHGVFVHHEKGYGGTSQPTQFPTAAGSRQWSDSMSALFVEEAWVLPLCACRHVLNQAPSPLRQLPQPLVGVFLNSQTFCLLSTDDKWSCGLEGYVANLEDLLSGGRGVWWSWRWFPYQAKAILVRPHLAAVSVSKTGGGTYSQYELYSVLNCLRAPFRIVHSRSPHGGRWEGFE